MLLQIIRKGNYQVFLADAYQTKSTPFICYLHCTQSLKCMKTGLKLGNPTARIYPCPRGRIPVPGAAQSAPLWEK